jgi:hypothetical protein
LSDLHDSHHAAANAGPIVTHAAANAYPLERVQVLLDARPGDVMPPDARLCLLRCENPHQIGAGLGKPGVLADSIAIPASVSAHRPKWAARRKIIDINISPELACLQN